MRTVPAAVSALEIGPATKPTETLIAYDNLLRFYPHAGWGNQWADPDLPASTCLRDLSGVGYAAWRGVAGNAWVNAMTVATPGDWNWTMSQPRNISVPGTYAAMKNAVFTDASGQTWLYNATHSAVDGTAIQVQRMLLTGLTNPIPALAWSNFGPAFGPARSDTATLLRRVEAVCPTDGGVVVCVGTHDYTNLFSTLHFVWIDSAGSAVYACETHINMPFDEVYAATPYYAAAKYAAYVQAIYLPAEKSILVVANAHPLGRAVQFHIRQGVCSMLEDVLPVDPTYGMVTLTPTALSSINGLYYLTARYTERDEGTETIAFDLYLTSSDGQHWSAGERNCFLSEEAHGGELLLDHSGTTAYLYCGGHGGAVRAEATPDMGWNASSRAVALSKRMQTGYTFNQVTNGPCSASFPLRNSDGLLDDHAIACAGATLRYAQGQNGTNTPIADFVLETPGSGVTSKGRKLATFAGRDAANVALTEHALLTDFDYWGLDVLGTDLTDLTGLETLTPTDTVLELDENAATKPDPLQYEVTVDATSHLQLKTFNNPWIARAEVRQAATMLMRATAVFPDTGDTHDLPALLLGFGAGEDGSFHGVLIPATSTWAPVRGGVMDPLEDRPKVVSSNLAPFDETENTGGYNFEMHHQGLWVSNDYDGADPVKKYLVAAKEVTGGTYITNGAWAATPDELRDYVVWLNGRRVVLFTRQHDYDPTTCASHAGHTRVLDYRYGDSTRLIGDGVMRPLIGGNCDVWAQKDAFPQDAYSSMEVSLSDATDYKHYPAYYNTIATGTVTEDDTPGDAFLSFAVTGVGTHFTTELRVGQYIRLKAGAVDHVRIIAAIVDDIHMSMTIGISRFGRVIGGNVYIRSSGYYGDASSGGGTSRTLKDENLNNTVLWIDPKPVKTTVPMIEYASLTGNDPDAMLMDNGWWESDGVTHKRLDKGYDPTNPIPVGKYDTYYSAPDAWKLVMHHNGIGRWKASDDKGLPAEGNMALGKQEGFEVLRYKEYQITLFNENLSHGAYANTDWITGVPTYYALPYNHTAASQTVYNKIINGGYDDFNNITDANGLFFEVTGRSAGGAEAYVPNVYVTGKGGGVGVRGFVTIDTMPAGPILDTDFITISGRRQKNTQGGTHDSDEPVFYYPSLISDTDPIASILTLSRFEVYSGRYSSIEDALTHLCAGAGVRNLTFRSLTNETLTLTASAQALSLPTHMADFVLDMEAHIDATAWLYVDFRSATGGTAYYRLAIKETATGMVTVGIQAIGSGITAGGLGVKKWLEYAEFPISGKVLCPTIGDTVNIRFVAEAERLYVEVNGLPTLSMDLTTCVHTDGTSYDVRGAYTVAISTDVLLANNVASFRVPELWGGVRNLTSSAGSNTSSLIQTLSEKYFLRARVKAAGGLEFGQYRVRDVGPQVRKAIASHDRQFNSSEAKGFFSVAGDKSGSHINAAQVREHGFSTATASNNDIRSVQQAQEDAQLRARETIEFSYQETVNATCRSALECEDKIELAYGKGNAPAQAPEDMVITSVSWTRGNRVLNASYQLRRYVEWLP